MRSFNNLHDAIAFAQGKAREVDAFTVVSIWDAVVAICIGVVVDDTNGLRVHRLDDNPTLVERAVWDSFGVS